MWKKLGLWTAARLKEPSTYSGAAGFLLALGVSVDPGMVQSASAIGALAAGGLGMVLSEKK